MNKISCNYTDEVVCPYCGYEYNDSWEFYDYEEEECCECGKSFYLSRHVEVTYCTEKI